MFCDIVEDLPDLAPSWLPGLRPQSVGRGNLGLGLQAQEILANLHDNIIPIREPLATLLGRRPHTQASTLVAILCGLDRNTTGGLLRRLAATPEARHDPKSSTGRKRNRSELPDLEHIAEDELVSRSPAEPFQLPDSPRAMLDVCETTTDALALVFGGDAYDCAEAPNAKKSNAIGELSLAPPSLMEPSTASAGRSENQDPKKSMAHVLLGTHDRESLYVHWAAAAAVASPYQGLGAMPPAERELAVGLRLCGLAAKLLTDGAGLDDFARWLHVLDAHLPGEWGNINHSKYFVDRYGDCLLQALHEYQLAHLQTQVRALRIPSDYARSIDGFTPRMGESLLIHVILSLGAAETFPFKWVLLDLTPQSLQASADVRGEFGRPLATDVLGYHGAVKTVDKLHTTENRCGLERADRALRYAVTCGDGAVEGPYGLGIGEASAIRSGLSPRKGWGSLDGFHAVDKGGAAADSREKRGDGLVTQFHKALRGIRANFAFGNGRTVARSTARRFQMSWRSPLAPHSDSTRAVMYESGRCPPNLFSNLRTVAYSIRFREKEAIENCRRQAARDESVVGPQRGLRCKAAKALRSLGREVVDARMLLFVCARWEHRRSCLLPYGNVAQSLTVCGLEKVVMQEEVLAAMSVRSGALQALANSTRILRCLDIVVPRMMLRSFFRMIWWRTAGKEFPTLVARGMEVLFNRTFQGLPLGLKWDTLHPFAEPGDHPIDVGGSRQGRVQASRMRTICVVEASLLRSSTWAKEERRAFADRVVNWEVHRGGATSHVEAPVECLAPVDAESDLSESNQGSDTEAFQVANVLDTNAVTTGEASSLLHGDSDSSSSESSFCGSGFGDGEKRLLAAENPQLMENRLEGHVCAFSLREGKIVLSTLDAVRQRRLEAIMAGQSDVGQRRMLLTNAAHIFSASWLLADWSGAAGGAALENRRPCLKILHGEFASLLWGIPPAACPYEAPPPELFKPISFAELWIQYSALNKFCRRVVRQAECRQGVASVWEKTHVKARYWDGRQAQWRVIVIPVSCVVMSSMRTESTAQSTRDFVTCKGWGEVEVLESPPPCLDKKAGVFPRRLVVERKLA